ncbi:hypothetical protein Bca4012_067282 [Brassica carinata]
MKLNYLSTKIQGSINAMFNHFWTNVMKSKIEVELVKVDILKISVDLMEGHSSWKPNEQGGGSLANDWRSQHEPDLRKKVTLAILKKLQMCFPGRTNGINKTAITFEDKVYSMAKDKGDYLRKIHEKMIAFGRKFGTGTSANGAITPHPAQTLNQGQSLLTSLTTTSQQRLPQNNIQSNLNIPDSSGLPTQAPITVSAAQNLNIQMGEGVHSDRLPCPQRQIQGRQQILPQTPQNLQQHRQLSLLKQPIGQKLPHHTSLSPIKQSFPESSALSSLPTSSQQNSQFLPRHQMPTQRVHSSHQQQMAEHKQLEQKQLISQVMNGQDTQQNHLTSRQNNGEKQRTSQQNNMASFNVHGSSLFGTQDQEVEQSQPMMLQQHQPNNPVQQQQPHNRILQQHLDDIQRFQAADSLHRIQNLADHHNQPYQLQGAHPANPSNSTGKMVNTSGGDWREETYQKIDSLPQEKPHSVKNLRAGKNALEQVIVFLNVGRSGVSEKHRDRFSVYEAHVLSFTKPQRAKQQQQAHLPPSQIHQTALQSLDSDQMNSRLITSHQKLTSQREMPHSSQTRPKMEPKDDKKIMSSSGNVVVHSLKQNPQLLQRQQQKKEQQTNQLQIPENEMSDVRMRQRVNSKAELLQQHLSSSQSQLPKPSASPARVSPLASSPQMQNYPSPHLVEQQTLPTPFNKTAAQAHPLITLPPDPIAERPIDRLIKAFQSSSPESLAQSVSEMSSVISNSDRFAGSVHSIRGSRARIAEDLSARTRFRLQQGDTNPTKRFKRSVTAIPLDATASSDSKVNKIEPSCALLQEIMEINGRLVETVVSICNEDVCPSEVTSGTVVVTCSYVPVALSATFKALYNSGHISQIQPLRLLVPENYPSSPIVLDKVSFDTARYESLVEAG